MRANCRCCGDEYSVNANGTIRYHLTDKPECQDEADENSRKCKGVGRRPREERCENCGHAGHGHADMLAPGGTLADLKDCTDEAWPGTACACARELREMSPQDEVAGYVCRIPAGPTGCGRAVQLTANGRARSHLNPQGERCEGGSDWPIAVDDRGNRRDTAPRGEVRQAVAPEDLLIERKTEIMDPAVLARQEAAYRLGTGAAAMDEPDPADLISRARAAGDGRTPEQQAEIDRRRADPIGSAMRSLGFDPQDPDGPGEPASDDLMDVYGRTRDGRVDPATAVKGLPPEERAAATDLLFDPVHTYDDGHGGQWQHPGPADACRLPECCTHPRGFEWGDDGKGHSGSFCPICGMEADAVERPGPDDWKCPADLLMQMPPEIVGMAATCPVCWDCGHEVTPLVETFKPSGKPDKILWGCKEQCAHWNRPGTHIGEVCRPQAPWQDRLGFLEPGDHFIRHTTRGDGTVFRVVEWDPASEIVTATVVSAGPHHGATGSLANPQEEITCTDHNGQRLQRRALRQDPATGDTSPSSPGPQPPTPSAPAPAAPESSPTATATARSSGQGSTASAPTSSASSAGASTRARRSGPTETAATSTRSARKMTDAFTTAKDAEVPDKDKYDRWGRYKVNHPANPSKKVAWTRATTFAKSVQDTFALSQWAQRMTLKGAALRPDIVAAAGTLEVKKDKDQMNALVEDAKKAAGVKVAANKGTAVHSYTEHRDRGEEVEIPEEYVPTVDAYEAVLKEFGLEPVPGLIEFTTAVAQFEIVGTSDRCYRVTRDITIDLNGRPVTLYAGEYVIGDVKTGADLSYGWQEIAIQLAIYAQGLNSSGVWSWASRTWSRPEDPDQPGVQIQVRTDVGVVPHLPVDREETGAPLATLYAVDLTAGWAACVLCGQVRSWRKESKLAVPLKVADLAPAPARPAGKGRPARSAAASQPPEAPAKAEVATRPPTLQERAQAVRNKAEASAVFQAAVAAKVSRAELDALIDTMQRKLASHVEKGA